MITQDRLKELLHYDPETGVFIRKSARGRALKGSRAGSSDDRGYTQVTLDRELHYAHRLAFLYMLGALPPNDVDHINGDKSDNRWGNLRPATRSQNLANTRRRSDNTSGHRGVTYDKRYDKWHARGVLLGKSMSLGYFEKIEDAAEAARSWRAGAFKEFAQA